MQHDLFAAGRAEADPAVLQPLPLADADLRFAPQWVPADQAAEWFARLRDDTVWTQPSTRVYARTVPVPRRLAWVGDVGYGYSGLRHDAAPWTPLLAAIRARVEAACGQSFNGLLLNYYRDGRDRMGWHSDDESVLGRNPVIASLNLGGTRRFDLRRRGEHRIAHSIDLGPGSLLVMGGATQHHWQHQIARTAKEVLPRINLTFRRIGEIGKGGPGGAAP
ncbi:alpha-ketoglutarate-dependent dioxygenase AlkB [uncultured Xylophilus sp.]|uniref:alpha-ketoglutarate-dependent dioxygenase AlkB family protein n=1 Tax=uncultured Xylophilus sp. TaxID=296832 RepID=UPI002601318A|nr:alpha-ketoglutarate-dependent dioxygenase AlkB [uncultured Xylophilus sp.]